MGEKASLEINFMSADTAPTTPYLLVKATSTEDEVELCASAEDHVIGAVASVPRGDGGYFPISALGVVKLIADGAIVRGESIVPGASGKATGGAGDVPGRHIGYALTAAAADGDEFWAVLQTNSDVILSSTINAEAGNAITVDLQGDPAGGGAKRFLAEALDPDGGESANYTLAETGAGAEVNTTGGPALVFSLSAAGAAQLTVTDGSGTATETMLLKLTPVGHPGPVEILELTFA